MHIISSIIFALSANIDCLAVGLSYGIKAVRIDGRANVIIAVISCMGTWISMEAGTYITAYLSSEAANIIGSVLLMLIGGWMVLQRFIHKKKTHKNYDEDHSGTINGSEAVLLAFALTINNMGLGISGSITGLPVYATCGFTFLISLLFIRVSQHIGSRSVFARIAKGSDLISGLLIFLLGLVECFV